MKDSAFQRVGSISNTHVGREFEDAVQIYFHSQGIKLTRSFPVAIGYPTRVKKVHRFDLGSDVPPILIECKANTWTKSGKRPSAKIRGMNEAMLHFHLAPPSFRKILVLLKHLHPTRTSDSLAAHYIRTQIHLIGTSIEVLEFDLASRTVEKLL